MEQERTFPVYLIAGFLDSGKTSFINGILEDGFADEEKTLLICCEEGEVEYDSEVLRNVTVVTVDHLEQLTPRFLRTAREECGATQILIEYNGMWLIETLYEDALPYNWEFAQIVFMAEGPTFETYLNNMSDLVMDKLVDADMVVINRCNEAIRTALRHKRLRLLNHRAEIFLEDENGEAENYADGTVSSFDLEQDVLNITDEDYGLWYTEIMDSPQMYEGKTVVFRAMMKKPEKYTGGFFTPGRFATNCCEEDMEFFGIPCTGYDVSNFQDLTWVKIKAKCTVYPWEDEDGERESPLLQVMSVKTSRTPTQEILWF